MRAIYNLNPQLKILRVNSTFFYLLLTGLLLLISSFIASEVSAARQPQPTGQFELIDVNNSGIKADQGDMLRMTKDAKYILFQSAASNLGVTSTRAQLFVRDIDNKTTELVSITPEGNQFTSEYSGGFISGDGRYVSFSDGSNIYVRDRLTDITTSVGQINNRGIIHMTPDTRYFIYKNPFSGRINPFTIYLYDSQTGSSEALAVNSNGEEASYTGGDIYGGTISDDGRFVVFNSGASNLAPNDTNNVRDLFIRDRLTGTTSFLYGNETPGDDPYISADGRYITFNTDRALVSQDRNTRGDYYLLDRQTNAIELITVTSSGAQTNDMSSYGKVSDDGRYVVFATQSTNFNPYNSTWLVTYLRDRVTGTTELVGQNPFCKSALFSVNPYVSNDGRFVSFSTPDRASTLDLNDNSVDVYLRDRTIPFGTLAKRCN